jgi:hypothetical protein
VGLSTENAHIFTAGNPDPGLEQAAAAVRQFMSGTGFEEAGDASDRVFTLVAHPDWISVYDTETGSIDGLVRGLSKSLAASVAGIRIEDSDKYTARLCRSGRWVDKISAGVMRKKGVGKPELWAQVLAPEAAEEIARALEGGGTFAEEPLRHLCRAIRLPEDAALALPEEISQQPPPDARVLRYRALHRKAPEGPPRLVLVSTGIVPATVGERVQRLFVALSNDGPTAKGLRVRWSGDALTEGLLTPIELRVGIIVSIGGGMAGEGKLYPLERDADGWFTTLPALELKHRVDPRSLPPGPGLLKAVRDYHRSPVFFHLNANAARAGVGELTLSVEWLEGEGAPLEVRLPITIDAA